MTTAMRRVIARHPITAYLAIAFLSTWAMTGLLAVSILFGLVALFGPAFAAALVSWADGTTPDLRRRIADWHEPRRYFVGAFSIPFAVSAVALLAYLATGHPAPGIGSIGAIDLVIFVLVIGEEIGWRGFLMPRLRTKMSLPAAGLITGIVWTLWHLPIYLQPGQGLGPFLAFAWWVVPFAIVLGFVAERARYSVLVATVMHGAANIAMPILLPNVDHTWTMLASGTVYLVIAVSLVVSGMAARSVAGTKVVLGRQDFWPLRSPSLQR